MIEYLIGTLMSLGLVYGSYWVFFRRETHFRWNRFWLLGGTVFSLILPLLSLPSAAGVSWAQKQLPELLISPLSYSPASNETSLIDWIPFLYLAICGLMAMRLIYQYLALRKIIQNQEKSEQIGKMQKVSDGKITSCSSFFHYLFVPTNFDISNHIDRSIFFHEKAHQELKHSFDLMLFQILKCFLWFNPFLHLLEKELKLVHEFQADAAVLGAGEKKVEYMKILAEQAFPQFQNLFTHSFNKSSITQRIKKMNQKRSGKKSMLKTLIVLPIVLFALFIISCERNDKLEEASLVELTADIQPSFPDGEKAMLMHLYTNIKYPKEAREAGLEGLAVIAFTVKKDGSLSDFKVERDPGGGMGNAAIEAIKSMPNWEPATVAGEAVELEYRLPVRFKLED